MYTTKGNIAVVENLLRQSGLLLEHPNHNPHNAPPGGHARAVEKRKQDGAGREQGGTDKADGARRYRGVKRQRSMSREIM